MIVFLYLILFSFMPTCLFYFGLASSMTIGLSAVCVCVIIFTGSYGGFITSKSFIVSTIILGVIIIHSLILSIFRNIDFSRTLLSLIPLLLFLLSGEALANKMVTCDRKVFNNIIFANYISLTFIAFLSMTGITNNIAFSGADYVKPVFPFAEPSHFALVYAPFILYSSMVSKTAARFVILTAGLFIAIKLQSLVLLIILSSTILFSMRLRYLYLFIPIYVVFFSQVDLVYYMDRLDLSASANNLTALIYIQGWQLIYDSLIQTTGYGVGFQQLGIDHGFIPAAYEIYLLTHYENNLLDGGFVLAKYFSEFGLLGGIIIMVYFYIFFNSLINLRSVIFNNPSLFSVQKIFAMCVIVSYSIELFFRGIGYFSVGFALLITAIFITLKR